MIAFSRFRYITDSWQSIGNDNICGYVSAAPELDFSGLRENWLFLFKFLTKFWTWKTISTPLNSPNHLLAHLFPFSIVNISQLRYPDTIQKHGFEGNSAIFRVFLANFCPADYDNTKTGRNARWHIILYHLTIDSH